MSAPKMVGPFITTLSDSSGTVGTSSAELVAANTSRRYLFIQNVSAGTIWIDFGTDAVTDQPSIKIPADGSFTMEGNVCTTQAVNAIGSGAGLSCVAKEA